MTGPTAVLFGNMGGLTRLPLPEKPETDVPERHHFGGEELRRITWRMMRALSRLGASPGQPVAIVPGTALEHFLLWLASCALGAHPIVLNEAAEVSADAPVLVCPPPDKEVWQQRAPRAKVATLGGPWSGSFFMLQMVQPETPPASDVTPGETRFANSGETWAFDALLRRADALATDMKEAQAVLLCLPPLADADSLLAVLAAMRSGMPLFWLLPAEVKKGLTGVALPDDLLAIAAPDVAEPLRRRLPATARVVTPGDMRA